ncbi:MAG: tetratricopeptide repeat protein [bacterium]
MRLRKIRAYPEALMRLRRAVEEEPGDPWVRFWLAYLLAETGEYTEAEEEARQVLNLDANHPDAARLLEKLRQREDGASSAAAPRETVSVAGAGFESEPLPTVKKKVCPGCGQALDKGAFYCRRCGYSFKTRIMFFTVVILAVSLSLLLGFRWWFWRFYGYAFNPAVAVNKAGNLGERIQVRDAVWNCAGMGLLEAAGRGYNAQVKGQLINIGDAPVQKAGLTIHFTTLHGLESTYIYFDVYSWRPGQAIEFDFPLIYPPLKATGCEIRINEVVLEPDVTRELEQTRVFVPRSEHFLDWIFRDAEGEIGALRPSQPDGYMGQTARPVPPDHFRNGEGTQSSETWLSFLAGLLQAFAISYIALMGAVLLVNVCEEGRKWNQDWRLDAQACLWVVICFVLINAATQVIGGVFSWIPLFAGVAYMLGFFWKIYLFFLFFKRETGMTILLIVFYFCLALSLQGLWMNVTG